MLQVEVQSELPRKPSLPMSLEDVRTGLAMTQQELSYATHVVLGRQGKSGVSIISIWRAENGIPISKITATKILITVNHIHKVGRDRRYTLGIKDITWTISKKKSKKGKDGILEQEE